MTDAQSDLGVGISVRVIPDGLDRAAGKLKLSLVLRPDPDPASGGARVSLDTWPTDIQGLLQPAAGSNPTAIVISVRIDGGAPVPPISLTGAALASALKSSPSNPNAGKLWRRIFTGASGEQFQDLLVVLGNQSIRLASIRPDAPVLASRYAVLATALEQLRVRHTASHLAILQLPPDQRSALRLTLRSERAVSLDYLKSKAFKLFGVFQPSASLDQIYSATSAMRGVIPDQDHTEDTMPTWYRGPTTLQWRSEAQQGAATALSIRKSNQEGLNKASRGGHQGKTISDALDGVNNLFSEDVRQLGIFSPFGRNPASITKNADDDINLRHCAEHALANLPDPPKKKFRDIPLESPARRKFFGIMQRPSLASFLGLILDLEVPIGAVMQTPITTPVTGKICAWVGDPATPLTTPVWTAFKLSPMAAGSTPAAGDYFGPISKYAKAQPDNLSFGSQLHIDDGLVNLNVKTNDNAVYRYVMLNCDVQAGAISTEGSASAAISQERQGIAQDQITTRLQTLRTRGVAIIDMQHAESTSRDLQDQTGGAGNPVTLYAEDLLMGYRLDVGIREGHNGLVWRSTAERDVSYDDPLMRSGAGQHWAGPFPERDDAFFRPLTRVSQTNPDPSRVDQPQVVAYENLVTWRGASLAFPTPRNDAEFSTPHKPAEDLAVDSIISPVFPGSGSTRHSAGLPALRFLDRVATSLRCVWLNGGSLSLTEANLRRQDPSKKLWLDRGLDQIQVSPVRPAPPTEDFTFLRYEEVPAPTWHLHAEDRVTVLSPKKLANLPGDQIDRLVLRSPVNSQWGRPRRWLLPAQVQFDLAELHGVFDSAPELQNTPNGAFRNIRRDAKGFPEAVDGAVVSPEEVRDQTHARGTVVESGAVANDAKPYYPDPLAETLYASFRRGDNYPDGYRNRTIACTFNPRAQWPKHATPVLIELVPIGSSPSHDRGGISVTSGGAGQGQTLAASPKITVELAPGEEVDLLLWCAPAKAAPLTEHWVIRSASAFANVAFADDLPAFQAAKSILSDTISRGVRGDQETPSILTSGSPIPNLSATRRLRLVYPVEKPLLPPALSSPTDFRMIRVVDSLTRSLPAGSPPPPPPNADPVQHLKDVWQNYVQHMGSIPQANWSSEASATRAFFIGGLVVEKASTSSVVCEARWFDFVDDATTIKKDNDGKYGFSTPPAEKLPWRSPPLVTVTNSTVEPGGVASAISLFQDDGGALRALNFDFGDTKARRLSLRLVAHSRFDKYFSANDRSSPDGVGQFDRSSDIQEVWLDSTAKPAAPVLLPTIEALPVFSFSTKQLRNGFVVERVCSIQLKVPIPSWWSSGEGELLAIVFPDGLFGTTPQDDRNNVSALERTDPGAVFVAPAGDYLTRRGHDPIRRSGHLGPFITKEDLIDKSGLAKGQPVAYVDGLSMTVTPDDSGGLFPPPANAPPAPASPPINMSVSIATYRPTVDEETGKTRNCLVRIDPGQSFWPFVRLVLARYQPHAISGMELSAPVETWAKIGPRRTASVEFVDEKKRVTLTVEGQGFHLANPGPVLFKTQHSDVDRPYLNIRLVRAAKGSQTGQTGWLPVIHGGRKVEWLEDRADYDFEGYVRWIKSIELPKPRSEEHYGLIVEEYFKMPSDQLNGDDKDKGSILVDGHVLFAAVLDLSMEVAFALPKEN